MLLYVSNYYFSILAQEGEQEKRNINIFMLFPSYKTVNKEAEEMNYS
jgi:hypothetical protein